MKNWRYRGWPQKALQPELAERLQISPLFLRILQQRGLNTEEAINKYLNARLRDLTGLDSWPHISQAAQVIVDSLAAGKKMAVWGDYDVDGVTATTLVLEVLEAHGFEAMHHIPHRINEGYGLNIPGIEKLAAQGCSLLLTVDCGISNIEAVQRAQELGITVIISDHHLPPPQLPKAQNIVDPRMDGEWPCVNLAGVGVAFYLMAQVNQYLSQITGKRYKMDHALDLVALGTLADVVLLDGDNRILVRAGLAAMEKARRPGISALKDISALAVSEKINSTQAAFRLAPRINAAGRMDHAEIALDLLRSSDAMNAAYLAASLDEKNTERKARGAKMFDEAREQAEGLLAERPYSGLVLYRADWHPGIVGIVASRIVEEFNRPAIVLCGESGLLKGSGRSVPDFDLYNGLLEAREFLSGFGGHKQAAGVKVELEALEDFRDAFSEACFQKLGEKPSAPVLMLECELTFSQARNSVFLQELELMEPFGPGNEEPVFSSPPLQVQGRRILGASGEHVQLDLLDKKSLVLMRPKAWRMAEQFPPDLVGKDIQIAYTPKMETYHGLPRVELEIRDWHRC